MRYLVRARVKSGREADLLAAIDRGTLGAGSVAGGEYLRNMRDARLCDDGTARWVEVCFLRRAAGRGAAVLGGVLRAHPRAGRTQPPALPRRDGRRAVGVLRMRCTEKLETQMRTWGRPFLEVLREAVAR
jgi:hypothetical protein